MADYSGILESPVITSVPTTADSVYLSGASGNFLVQVTSLDGKDVLSVRADGTAAVSGAAECFAVPAIAGASIKFAAGSIAGGRVKVSVICPSSATKYQVALVVGSQS